MFFGLIDLIQAPLYHLQQTITFSMGESVARVLIWTTLFAAFGLGLLAWIKYRKAGLALTSKDQGLGAIFGSMSLKHQNDNIKLLSSKRIAPGQMIISVQWHGREFLLGATPHGISVLAEQNLEDGR